MKKFSVHPISIIIWLWLWIVLGAIVALSYVLAITIHELGHFLVAKKLGYNLTKFSLSPYGVSLSYYCQDLDFRDEIKIALAGPLANLLSAFLVLGVWWLFPSVYFFTEHFVCISVLLCLINLLPAFPMDGGRIFVCIFSHFFNKKISKKITIFFNLALSLLFFVLFIVFCFINFNPSYLLISCFLFVGFLDFNFVSKYEKINVFCKKTKNFSKINAFFVNSSVTIGELLAHIQSSRQVVFCLILENGKIINLSEKLVLKLSLNYPYNCSLNEIFGN